jgi:hypothetical protein
MAWTAPFTASANTAFTAAQFNTVVRDNLNETAPAKATTAGRIFVTTGANAIAERAVESAEVVTNETTTSTTYADLATSGPAVTLTTGVKAMIIITGQGEINAADAQSFISYAVTGASSVAAADENCLVFTSATSNDPYRASAVNHQTLTAGSNTITLKYRVSASTGTFRRRQLIVIGF